MTYLEDPEEAELLALRGIADFEGARVLEIGTGDGRLLMRIVDGPALVVGSDPNASSLAKAREDVPTEFKSRVALVVARAESLPFADSSYDYVLFGWSL